MATKELCSQFCTAKIISGLPVVTHVELAGSNKLVFQLISADFPPFATKNMGTKGHKKLIYVIGTKPQFLKHRQIKYNLNVLFGSDSFLFWLPFA